MKYYWGPTISQKIILFSTNKRKIISSITTFYYTQYPDGAIFVMIETNKNFVTQGISRQKRKKRH